MANRFSKTQLKEDLKKAQSKWDKADWALTKYRAYEHGDSEADYFRKRDAAAKAEFSPESVEQLENALSEYIAIDRKMLMMEGKWILLEADVRHLKMIDEFFSWEKQFERKKNKKK